MTRGKFITFEGGEGAGKTTLISRLKKALSDAGHTVTTTVEPGGVRFGEMIRQWVLHRDPTIAVGARAEMLLFLSARLQNIEEKILPSLERGEIVLCDRFNDSTIAYQGGARGLGVEWVQHLCDHLFQGVGPDLTFFLDLDPVEGMKRSTGDGDLIEDEKLTFHHAVRDAYRQIAAKDPERVVVLDANQSEDAVFEAAWSHLNAH